MTYPKNLNEWLVDIEARTNRCEHVIPSDVAALCRIVRATERLRSVRSANDAINAAADIASVLDEVELKMTDSS